MSKEINVLFIDDEHAVLDVFHKLFSQEPYGIIMTTNPDQVMEILRRENIKVVVSDQNMPQVQGVKLLQDVKQFNPDIVRILLTAHADFSAAEEAINIGEVYRVITKPWKSADLISTIHRAIERYDLTMRAEAGQ